MVALACAACLERVTDSPPALDPRFYESGEQPSGQGSGSETLVPFAGYDGPKIKVSGVIRSDKILPVDLDLWKLDPRSPGNREHLGKIPIALPGAFVLEVPPDLGGLQVEAFHDLTGDGPTNDDPFGATVVTVGPTDVEGLEIRLVPGARGQASSPAGGANGPVHVEAPPGAPGGAPVAPPAGGAPPEGAPPPQGSPTPQAGSPTPMPENRPDPFASVEGPRVALGLVLEYGDPAAVVDLDVFRVDPQGPGGRAFAGKVKASPGPVELKVPTSFGKVTVEAFVDPAGDGPTAGDPFAACPCNPVDLSRGDQAGIRIQLR